MKLENVNAMPAITWHFLRANDAVIEVPEGLVVAPDVRVSESGGDCVASEAPGDGAEGTFAGALAAAQAKWEKANPAPSAEELAEREAFRAADADATYGGTALSAYQANADALEESRSLSASFSGGVGEEAADFLVESAGERTVVQAGPGETVDVQVVVAAAQGAVNVAALDVVADRGGKINLSIAVNESAEGSEACESAQVGGANRIADETESRAEACESAQAGAASNRTTDENTSELVAPTGLAGTTLRVFASEDARVNIVRTQTLGDGFVDIDDMGLFADERAYVTVRQTVLGAGAAYTGLAGDLRGDSARVDVDTRYLGHGEQVRDFNYSLRHHGTRTKCNLNANGVLAGKSRKTLRGTIDLIRGCKGSEGSENETVLLVDEGVRNKTVPVILCNEDDVAGNHGATIGHIRDEQLFYLASRGLSQEAAEAMFLSAALEQAYIDSPDGAAREGVARLGERIVPGFAELIE